MWGLLLQRFGRLHLRTELHEIALSISSPQILWKGTLDYIVFVLH